MERRRLFKRIALAVGFVVAFGCGGRLGCDDEGNLIEEVYGPNGPFLFNWNTLQGTAAGNSFGNRVRFRPLSGSEFECELLPGVSVNDGDPLSAIPKDSPLFTNAWIPSGVTPWIKLGVSGNSLSTLGAKPMTMGNNLVISDGVALTPNRYELQIGGPFQLMNTDITKGLTLGNLKYEFDVFSNGFSNIPIRTWGTLPRNGATSTGFSVTGEIPPNSGQGPAYLDLTKFGGVLNTYTTTKGLGDTTWTWDADGTYVMPQEGLINLGMRIQF